MHKKRSIYNSHTDLRLLYKLKIVQMPSSLHRCSRAISTTSFQPFLSSLKRHYEKKGDRDRPLPSNAFLEWLVGFTEGDGCFFIDTRKDLSFILSQGVANKAILQKIQEELGMGRLGKQGKRVYRFVIQRKDEINLVIELFNGNLVLPSRKAQFQLFWNKWKEKNAAKAVLKEDSCPSLPAPYINRKNMPSLNDLWLLGFVEAEGCFSISFLSTSSAFRTRFLVSQKGDENIPILSSFVLLFGTGTIEGHSMKNNYSFIVSGLKNMEKIYPYFDQHIQHFLGIKKDSYLQFKTINKAIGQQEHLDEKKRLCLIEKAKQVNSVSRKIK